MKRILLIMVSILLFSWATGYAQQVQTKENKVDSAQVKKSTKDTAHTVNLWKPSPHKAMLLSAVVPGLGQVYNRSYWKVPIIYAGYAALIYAVAWNGHEYNQYKKAYISIADDDPSTNYYKKYLPSGYSEDATTLAWLENELDNKQLNYRRYRDLSIIGMVGLYGLTLLDAYVDAQLYDFDISPNLSLHMDPVLDNATNNTGVTFGIRCQLTF